MENILLSCHHIDLNLNEVPILEDINLSLNAGEFHLLIGENGTGKTSIVNILSGVYPAALLRIYLIFWKKCTFP